MDFVSVSRNKRAKEKQNQVRIKRRNPEAKMAFPSESLPGLSNRLTGRQQSSGTGGLPPARGQRSRRCGASAGECAAAAAGTGGWRARPPGSSLRTGSDCRRRRSPASERDWPGRSPAGCPCPRGNKSKHHT